MDSFSPEAEIRTSRIDEKSNAEIEKSGVNTENICMSIYVYVCTSKICMSGCMSI